MLEWRNASNSVQARHKVGGAKMFHLAQQSSGRFVVTREGEWWIGCVLLWLRVTLTLKRGRRQWRGSQYNCVSIYPHKYPSLEANSCSYKSGARTRAGRVPDIKTRALDTKRKESNKRAIITVRQVRKECRSNG